MSDYREKMIEYLPEAYIEFRCGTKMKLSEVKKVSDWKSKNKNKNRGYWPNVQAMGDRKLIIDNKTNLRKGWVYMYPNHAVRKDYGKGIVARISCPPDYMMTISWGDGIYPQVEDLEHLGDMDTCMWYCDNIIDIQRLRRINND